MRTVNERTVELAATMRELADNIGGSVRVAMPGIINSWDSGTQTAKVQVAIREKIIKDGSEKDIEIPLLVDVPVVMPRAGGYLVALAPRAGDEVLVVFADLCIDAWWQSGGVQNQDEVRRHDFSDAFAVFGCWSQKEKGDKQITLPDEGIRLQNDKATQYIHLKQDGTIVMKATAIRMNAGSVTVNGAEVETQ